MAIFGSEALTLSDLRKRLNPDGSVAFIVEALEQSNPILKDIPWIEGNLKTGNVTTVRTMIPTPHIRLINRGVPRGKSRTKQVQDTSRLFSCARTFRTCEKRREATVDNLGENKDNR